MRAVVVVDPLNLFDAAGVRKVHVPVQLWASEMGGDAVALDHVEAIRVALAKPPEFRIAKGAGHFAYLAPCPPEFTKSEPRLCADPDGFDREHWHETDECRRCRFLHATLADPCCVEPLGAVPTVTCPSVGPVQDAVQIRRS